MVATTRQPRQRSARRVLVPPLIAVLVVAAAVGARVVTGNVQFSALLLSGGIGLIALWALGDGIWRALGKSTYLGTGRGVDRAAAVFQILASIGAAIALLPNAVALLEVLAGAVA